MYKRQEEGFLQRTPHQFPAEKEPGNPPHVIVPVGVVKLHGPPLFLRRKASCLLYTSGREVVSVGDFTFMG